MVLFLATLVQSLAVMAAPVLADGNSVFRYVPPCDQPGPIPLELIYITCSDGQVQSYVAYGASIITLD